MDINSVIDSLFVVALVGILILVVMLIVLTVRANKVLNNWSKISDVLSDSLVKLIPAVVNVSVIGKGIHQALESIAEYRKSKDKDKE